MLNSEIGYSVMYYPIILTEKNLGNKLSNVNKILNLDQVLGVYSSETGEILLPNLNHEKSFNENVLNFLNKNNLNYDLLNGYLYNYSPEQHDEFINNINVLLENDESVDAADILIEILPDEKQNDQLRISSLYVTGLRDFCLGIEGLKYVDKITYSYNQFEGNQITFILSPIRVKKDNSTQIIYLTLDIINFKFAIIKTYQNIETEEELLHLEEATNIQIEMLAPVHDTPYNESFLKSKDTTDSYTLKNTEYKFISEIVLDEYIPKIFNSLKVDFVIDETLVAHYLFKKIEIEKELNYSEKNKIYRIINAPINHEQKLDKNLVQDLYKDSFNISSNKVWASKKGTILSYVDEVVLDSEQLDSISRFFSFESVVDFPLKTVILERLNNIYLYTAFFNKNRTYEESQKEYIQNEIRLLNISDSFYGSALDLITYLKQQMKWYINENSFKIRNRNLQLMKENDSIEREKKNGRKIEVITLLLTIIFGFSAIKDILDALTKVVPHNFNLNESQLNTWSLYILLVLIVIQTIIFMDFIPKYIFSILTQKIKIFILKIKNRNKSYFK